MSAVAYATNGNTTLHWMLAGDRDARNVSLHGYADETSRDMAYSGFRACGGSFNYLAKTKGTEVAVRRLIDSKGWIVTSSVVR